MFTRIFTSVIDRVGKRCHRQGVRNFIQDSANKPSDAISQSQNSEVKLSRKERVINYFKMVKYDYTEALKEVTGFYKARPVKAGVYSTLFGLGLFASYTNPDERSFWDNFVVSAQDLSLVGDQVRSPGSQQLVDYVSRAYNAGLVRRLNLGVASLIWVDNYDEAMGLYAAQCDYLRPSWADMRHRVLDLGFMGRWWLSARKMELYDVNDAEWNEDGSPTNKSDQLKPMW